MMKKMIKKLMRIFFDLKSQPYDKVIEHVLFVEGGYISPGAWLAMLRQASSRFSSKHLVIVTAKANDSQVRANFPDSTVISSGPDKGMEKYGIAAELYRSLKKRPKFVVLTGLDISLLTTILLFNRKSVFYLNRQQQWCLLRQRTPLDIFKNSLMVKEERFNVARGLFKRSIMSVFNLIFVLEPARDGSCGSRVLLVDNGYTQTEHIRLALSRISELFINPNVSLLTFEERKSYFIDMLEKRKQIMVKSGRFRYRLALSLLAQRICRFDYVVLTTLDASALVASFGLAKQRMLLFNRWNQWWSLSLRSPGSYLKEIAKYLFLIVPFIFICFCSVIILILFKIRLMLIRTKVLNYREELL